MRISAAQFQPEPGDIERNIRRHVELIELASAHRAQLLLFPELSLTGYEPKRAAALAMTSDDPRLRRFQELADARGIVIAVGLPSRIDGHLRIAMVVFRPNAASLTYAKRHLHGDELPFFAPGEQTMVLEIGGHRLALAICYESLLPEHAAEIAASGADIYLASVAKSDAGIVRAFDHYPQIAQTHQMTVVMANAIGPCDDFVAAGQSAIWNVRGEQLVRLGRADQGLVMIDTVTDEARLIIPPA